MNRPRRRSGDRLSGLLAQLRLARLRLGETRLRGRFMRFGGGHSRARRLDRRNLGGSTLRLRRAFFPVLELTERPVRFCDMRTNPKEQRRKQGDRRRHGAAEMLKPTIDRWRQSGENRRHNRGNADRGGEPGQPPSASWTIPEGVQDRSRPLIDPSCVVDDSTELANRLNVRSTQIELVHDLSAQIRGCDIGQQRLQAVQKPVNNRLLAPARVSRRS